MDHQLAHDHPTATLGTHNPSAATAPPASGSESLASLKWLIVEKGFKFRWAFRNNRVVPLRVCFISFRVLFDYDPWSVFKGWWPRSINGSRTIDDSSDDDTDFYFGGSRVENAFRQKLVLCAKKDRVKNLAKLGLPFESAVPQADWTLERDFEDGLESKNGATRRAAARAFLKYLRSALALRTQKILRGLSLTAGRVMRPFDRIRPRTWSI